MDSPVNALRTFTPSAFVPATLDDAAVTASRPSLIGVTPEVVEGFE